MDDFWAAKENALTQLMALKDALERLIRALEHGTERVPGLAAIPDRIIILAATHLADLNERGIEADLDRIPEEIDRIYRAWRG